MSEFPQFDNAKLRIAASVRHCRTTIEDLPVGQIVVDEAGSIRSIDVYTEKTLGFEETCGRRVADLLVDGAVFPEKLTTEKIGDLGAMTFFSADGTHYPARLVCVPGAHLGTFLLSVVFATR